MNLLEAIKSNRPRRNLKHHAEWHTGRRNYFYEEIISEEWEIKEGAYERLMRRISLYIREAGIHPDVLDVSPEDYAELSSDAAATRQCDSRPCVLKVGLTRLIRRTE